MATAPQVLVLPGEGNVRIMVSSTKNTNGQRFSARFKADKEKLIQNSGYFKASLRSNHNLGPHAICLQADDVGAMRVWLFYLHAAKVQDENEQEDEVKNNSKNEDEEDPAERVEQDSLFQRSGIRDTNIAQIWGIITAGDKYLFNASILHGFFKRWYRKNVRVEAFSEHKDFAKKLALPCFMFDYAKGFAEVTKWLAYNNAGHITEKRPEGFKWQHMHLCPPDFVGPMNHARGGLKSSLHRGLWTAVGHLFGGGKNHCTCGQWAKSAGLYFDALVKVQVYPLETVFPKTSMNALLSRLGSLDLGVTGACTTCNIDWKQQAKQAKAITQGYFDGLCLDCMDKSKPPRGKNPDELYWTHLSSENGKWDRNCRIPHGEPSWYMSWCGRDEHRQKLLKEHHEKKKDFYRDRDGRPFF